MRACHAFIMLALAFHALLRYKVSGVGYGLSGRV